MSRALVPITPTNTHVLRMLVEARAAETLALRLSIASGSDPRTHLRQAYGLINKIAGRPAMIGE